MIESSKETDKLMAALMMATNDITPIVKTITNDFLGSKYAGLPEVLEKLKPIFQKHGLFVSAIMTSPSVDGIQITMRFFHASGQWERFTAMFPAGPKKGISLVQSAGASITYAIRYILGAYFLIAFEDDDDGNKPNKKIANQSINPKLAPVVDKLNIIDKIRSDKNLTEATKTSRITWLNKQKNITTIKEAGSKWGY